VSYVSGGRDRTLTGIVDSLRKAKVDPRVTAVFVKSTGLSTPYWAKVQELRDAITDYRSSGKKIYVYMEWGGDRDYYLATAADKVFLMPSSTLDVTGVATYEVFLRGTLDKVGVQADLRRIGAYKTAANQFTESGFTPEHREMTEALNRDLYEQIVEGIATARQLPDPEVRALLDEAPFLAPRALAAKLIDGIAYEDEALKELRDAVGDESDREISAARYARISLRSLGLNRGPKIAVIYAAGAITSGASGFDPLNGATLGSDTLIEAIRDARKDRSMRAIIVRIDSPGGSAVASDAIWHELMLARKEQPERPIIASMSDLAASGGYYIAMPADVIVAEPATITGSIGIFGGKFITGGLYGKLGATIESSSIGRHAEINSPVRPFNDSERAKLDEQISAFYQDFIRKAADSRGTTPATIDALAQGRVWTGMQAVQNGLVDRLGGLRVAVAIAKERAKIDAEDEVQLVTYPEPMGLYELLTEQLAGGASVSAAEAWMAKNVSRGEREMLKALAGPATLFRRGEALALMPFTFVR
jgi:protease-4